MCISPRFAGRLMLLLVFLLFYPSFANTAQAVPRVQGMEELEELREEISLLNLLRGLYLSEDQLTQLCEIAVEADNAVKSTASPILRDRKEIVATFADLRNRLFMAPGQETQSQQKAQQINDRLKEAQETVREHLARLETRMASVMTSAQLEIIEGFVPCLIPPRDLKNPVRVGQAGAAEGPLARMTELIYATPEDVWNERKMILIGKVVQKIEEESGKLSDAMRNDLLNRLSATAKKIRAIDQVDFALKKGDLADELLLIDHTRRGVGGKKALGKVGKWFLSETALRILPRWKEAMAAGMDQVTEADSTNDDFKIEPNTAQMAERLKNTLARLYRKGGKKKGLPPLEQLQSRIDKAEKSKDPMTLAHAVLETIDSLASAGIARQNINKALVQLIRGVSRHLKLPLINEKHDPYGFFAEFKAAQAAPSPEETFQGLRKLADMIVRFKKL
ncbi:MAG: hypothetical protein GQF41_4188 [Candidatus Rifleibacterium amylolyticum]|nr:MAG: hypothetical protein GQF41_4188 [Candidatus Rifleibacterium amylolyticum]